MTRKSNKGVSIVEILIALTIFLILLIPIVSSLITGMKTTTSAKELQYRNEYARNLMENVKEVPISVLNDTIDGGAADKFFEGLGAKNVVVSKTANSYEIKGETNIGTENTEYAFQINVDGSAYAAVNDLKNGVVEDLDQTKVALISAPLSNYDYSAYDALLTQKMAQLQQSPTNYDPANDIAKFNDDTCARTINITVTKVGVQYEVKCLLEYRDSSNCAGVSDVSVTYVPYCQRFDKLPNIYLMYNVGVYNGRYTTDTITYDLDNVTEDVKVFVVATPSDYASDYKTLASGESVTLKNTDPATGGSVLYRTADGANRSANPVTFSNKTSSKKANLYIYHNLGDVGMSVNCDVSPTGDFKSDNIGELNDAQNGRGLYQVKIRMQKGSSVDPGVNPVLQGTRGGDEIE